MPDLAEGDRELVIVRGLGYNSEGVEGHLQGQQVVINPGCILEPPEELPEDKLDQPLLCSHRLGEAAADSTGQSLTEGHFHSQ